MTQLSRFTGDQNVSMQLNAKGIAAARMKGMRRPAFDLQRSDMEAMIGSVTASNRRPKAVMPPSTVSMPSTTRPCGTKIGWPACWVARSGW